MVERYRPEGKSDLLDKYKKLNIATVLIFLAAGLPALAAIDLAQIALIDLYQRRKKKKS